MKRESSHRKVVQATIGHTARQDKLTLWKVMLWSPERFILLAFGLPTLLENSMSRKARPGPTWQVGIGNYLLQEVPTLTPPFPLCA